MLAFRTQHFARWRHIARPDRLKALHVKVGLEGIDSDFATLLRTVVIFLGERPVAREWVRIGMVAAGVLVLSIRR